MKREIEASLHRWKDRGAKKALLVDGARQVGKTYTVRQFGREAFTSYIEINFLENEEARSLFTTARNSRELLLYISAVANAKLIPGETLVFFDEVQECPEIVTNIKFLVEEGSYAFILSGSLLGIGLKQIRSVPVGYMEEITMYPMTFREFALATGVQEDVLGEVEACFLHRRGVPELIHDRLLGLFHLYLVVGGMPEAVQTYIDTNDLQRVIETQNYITGLNKRDISKYDPAHKLYIEDIYDRIPAELAAQNKRFEANVIKYGIKFDRVENGFLWLTEAGVAIAAFCANEPKYPLLLSKARNQLKLFLGDAGLLTSMYAGNMQIKILRKDVDINYGGIYENAVAQALYANRVATYYYRNNRIGEIDFLCEIDGHAIPVEVKSGKSYKIHSALNHLLEAPGLDIPYACIFSNQNVSVEGRKVYLPVYMIMYLKNTEQQHMIYPPNLDGLRKKM